MPQRGLQHRICAKVEYERRRSYRREMEGQTLKVLILATVLWCGTLPATDSQAFTLEIPVDTVYPELVPLYTRNSTGDNYIYNFHFSNHWATELFNIFCNESQQEAKIVTRDPLTQSVNGIHPPEFGSNYDFDGVFVCLVGNDTLICGKVDSEHLASTPGFTDYKCQASLPIEDEGLCKELRFVWGSQHLVNLHTGVIDGVMKENAYKQGCLILEPLNSTTKELGSSTFPTPSADVTCTEVDNLKEIRRLQQQIQGRMSLINQYAQEISGWQLDIQNRLSLIPGLTED